MHTDKDDDRTYRLDEEHLRILQEIERTSHQSETSQIREGIELFIRSKKCEPHSLSIFSPIISERPYRIYEQ